MAVRDFSSPSTLRASKSHRLVNTELRSASRQDHRALSAFYTGRHHGSGPGVHDGQIAEGAAGRKSTIPPEHFVPRARHRAKVLPALEAASRRNLRFMVSDARNHEFQPLSYACSLFTLQFINFPDKLPLLERVYDRMLDGGALLIAEKVLASSARLQDALTFPYYDFKRQTFDDRQILEKERSLRGQMCAALE